MNYACTFFILSALLSLVHATPTKAVAPSAKNMEPGCTIANAPAEFPENTNTEMMITDDKEGYVPCDNSNMGYRVRKAIVALSKLKNFDPSNRWAPSILGTDPYDFMKKRMDGLTIESDQKRGCDPLTGGFYQKEKTSNNSWNFVTVCPLAKNLSDVQLMELLLHEARHADDKKHVDCEFGPMSMLKNRFACDPSFEFGGAYAVSVEFSIAASRQTTLSPAQRQSARSEAIYLLTNRFNKLPKDLNFVAVTFPVAGGANVFDGKKMTNIITHLPADFQVASKSNVISFMSIKPKPELQFAYTGDKLAPVANQLLNRIDASTRQTLVDQADFGDMSCYLFTHTLACWPLSGEGGRILTITGRSYARFLLVSGASSKVKGLTAILVETNGNTNIIPSDFATMRTITDGLFVDDHIFDDFAKTFQDVITFPPSTSFPFDRLFIAKTVPMLFQMQLDKTTGRGVSVAPVEGITQVPLKKLIGPTVWSDLLNRL